MTAPSGDKGADRADQNNVQILHATSVAMNGHGALIRGASGSGKSGLALQLISLGASLVADDRTQASRTQDGIGLSVPEALRGKIEARGIGILPAPTVAFAKLTLVVDMDHTEEDRLPPWRQATVLGQSVPVVRKSDAAHFPAAILLYLQYGRVD